MSTTERVRTPYGLSAPATTKRVIELLSELDWPSARVADVGAGRGHFSCILGETLERERGLTPAQHVFPCDLIPETFEYDRLECVATRPDGTPARQVWADPGNRSYSKSPKSVAWPWRIGRRRCP